MAARRNIPEVTSYKHISDMRSKGKEYEKDSTRTERKGIVKRIYAETKL